MKRTSITAAARFLSAALCLTGTAWAVNPGQNQTNPNPLTKPYPSTTLPGQEYYNGLGNLSDPFLTPNLFGTTPTYPGLGNPQTNVQPTVPNPNPGAYPDPTGRTRVTTPLQPNYVPPTPGPNTPKKWRLGVYSKDLDTGVKIVDIVPGGAAARAGLEVNDQIIAVNGYQVGYVNGQLYDCGTEFERLADSNGWVTLLVHNNRDRGLLNVPCQLDSRLSTLRGSIAMQNRQNLPANAMVNVELRETIGNNPNSVTFASTQVNQINTYPIPFNLEFDPAHISPNGRYLVYASVLVNGQEIYRTTQPQRILDEPGPPRQVALQLDQVQANPGYPSGPMMLDQDAQVAQIVRLYHDYLGRDPSDRELVNFLDAMKQGYTVQQIQLALLGNDQFFNRCNQDKRVYIERMHELLVGRKPYEDEMSYWVARYDAQNGIRRELAREFQGALGIH